MPSHPVQQGVPKGGRVNRLGHKSVHAGFHAAVTVLLHGIDGHGHNREVLGQMHFPNQARGRHPVHHRPLHVHQLHFIGPVFGKSRLHHLDRDLPLSATYSSKRPMRSS